MKIFVFFKDIAKPVFFLFHCSVASCLICRMILMDFLKKSLILYSKMLMIVFNFFLMV
jgi:hypothetical protein